MATNITSEELGTIVDPNAPTPSRTEDLFKNVRHNPNYFDEHADLDVADPKIATQKYSLITVCKYQDQIWAKIRGSFPSKNDTRLDRRVRSLHIQDGGMTTIAAVKTGVWFRVDKIVTEKEGDEMDSSIFFRQFKQAKIASEQEFEKHRQEMKNHVETEEELLGQIKKVRSDIQDRLSFLKELSNRYEDKYGHVPTARQISTAVGPEAKRIKATDAPPQKKDDSDVDNSDDEDGDKTPTPVISAANAPDTLPSRVIPVDE